MFGTIGRATFKAGHEAQLNDLMDEWTKTIRPKIPGAFLNLVGHVADDPRRVVFVALAADRDTYRALADMPEQDAWYRKFIQHIEGDVAWEDVEMTVLESK